MTQPTKADLTEAVAKLTEQNAQLRELLAAVSELAGSVPQAVFADKDAELRRSRDTLTTLRVILDPAGTWTRFQTPARAAAELRADAARPVMYQAFRPAAVTATATSSADPFAAEIRALIEGSRS
jgi:hypothetical protein